MRVLSRLRRRTAGRPDRGAVALFVAICAAYVVLVIALVVDAGGRLRVAERTDAYALEAARVGGQQLDQAELLKGKGFKAQQKYAQDAADAYLGLYGLKSEHVDFSEDGKVVIVTVQADYRPVLLGALGERKVTGKGSATLVHGVEKAETD
ncbi:hypothetical protein BX285_5740 [Streptomyces sp. 1114.5]|uniref:hypothetical protein n=1 Tax=unclassified Streptomyces TaxID=2593676 RepID=UPI000BDCC30D|nr:MULTISPECIES: hypothetical protein [unclassified Streptomyces]RKT11785.1 hypothetical protein BX285_5740 [Streptomyces sp. 1114.5]SOB80519.1 hypothetical protein SAMN06272789_0989 [Streptomyces sp. 1331.2]